MKSSLVLREHHRVARQMALLAEVLQTLTDDFDEGETGKIRCVDFVERFEESHRMLTVRLAELKQLQIRAEADEVNEVIRGAAGSGQ